MARNLPAAWETWVDPWVGKIPWRRHGNPLQYSCLEHPMDRGAGQGTVHRVSKSRAQLKQLSMQAHTRFVSVVILVSFLLHMFIK